MKGVQQDEVPWCMMIANDVVLADVNTKISKIILERRRKVLEKIVLKIRRAKKKNFWRSSLNI